MPIQVSAKIDTFGVNESTAEVTDQVANATVELVPGIVTENDVDTTVGFVKIQAPTTTGADAPATTIYVRLAQLQSAMQAMQVQGLR